MEVLFALLFFVIYPLPALIGALRRHDNRCNIMVLNLLTGWTVIGWIIALYWALKPLKRHAKPCA